ncbi:thiolase family protein [Bacteroidetes/Chlorobi group bacterium ChocPot_Mid]|jgi:acetyl-CoA C-acetyltransferase|nr:MAG: thiolase family protein [Bacteroidetes/Chlorobi group bacterium ChocPot_Mid]
MDIKDIVAISACRTPMGNFGGTLKDIPSYELGAVSIKEAIKRAKINPEDIDEVLLGSCRQAGNGPNPARTAAVKGGVPLSVPVMTINMACPSGMKALSLATQVIRCGEGKIVLIGGFDSMSTIPYLMKNVRWEGFRMGNKTIEDGWSDSIDPLIGQGMGETAENLFEKYKISREEQDEFAVESHLKASQAQKNGWFKDEIVPVEIPATKQKPAYLFEEDETIRHTIDKEKMAKLKPAFRKDGVVTAGNACGLSDGSTALVITTRQMAEQLGVKPLFSIVSFGQEAVSPQTMGEGPGLSIPAALKNAGMTLSDMDLIEVNEAFAIQVLANERVLQWDRNKLNVHGGAIALGHPTGISGARIIVTLYYALKRLDKTFGVAGICGGGGVTMATVIKREL